MNYIKLFVLLLALPTIARAAEEVKELTVQFEEQSCSCSCSCFGFIKNSIDRYHQKQRIRKMLAKNPGRANVFVHTSSADFDHARLAQGLKLNTPSATDGKDKVRMAREVAYEIQADKAGVQVTDWKLLDASALARSQRPVIHRATVLAEQEKQVAIQSARVTARQMEQAAAREAAEADAALHARVSSQVFSTTLPLATLPPRLRESDEAASSRKVQESLTLPGQSEQVRDEA